MPDWSMQRPFLIEFVQQRLESPHDSWDMMMTDWNLEAALPDIVQHTQSKVTPQGFRLTLTIELPCLDI